MSVTGSANLPTPALLTPVPGLPAPALPATALLAPALPATALLALGQHAPALPLPAPAVPLPAPALPLPEERSAARLAAGTLVPVLAGGAKPALVIPATVMRFAADDPAIAGLGTKGGVAAEAGARSDAEASAAADDKAGAGADDEADAAADVKTGAAADAEADVAAAGGFWRAVAILAGRCRDKGMSAECNGSLGHSAKHRMLAAHLYN